MIILEIRMMLVFTQKHPTILRVNSIFLPIYNVEWFSIKPTVSNFRM